jgi:hypothetical protein
MVLDRGYSSCPPSDRGYPRSRKNLHQLGKKNHPAAGITGNRISGGKKRLNIFFRTKKGYKRSRLQIKNATA